MPKRPYLRKILLIGSAGPIVIGQACESDDAGTRTMEGQTTCW